MKYSKKFMNVSPELAKKFMGNVKEADLYTVEYKKQTKTLSISKDTDQESEQTALNDIDCIWNAFIKFNIINDGDTD